MKLRQVGERILCAAALSLDRLTEHLHVLRAQPGQLVEIVQFGAGVLEIAHHLVDGEFACQYRAELQGRFCYAAECILASLEGLFINLQAERD